jgi:hypothetical protein
MPRVRAVSVPLIRLALIVAGAGCPRAAPPAAIDPPGDAVAREAAPVDAGADRLRVQVADARPRGPRGTLVSVLYSTNLLGEYDAHPLGGLARRATVTEAARRQADGLVQVDGGDALLPALRPVGGKDPDPREVERRARLIATSLGRLRLDAMVPGETDLALGAAALQRLARAAHLPIVAANLTDGAGHPLFPPDRLVTAGAVKVGLFGVVGDVEVEALRKPGFTVTDATAAARRSVSGLRARGAQVVIALYHGAAAGAARLAAEAGGVDAVVLGHEQPAAADAPTPILQAHHHGTYLGRFDLHLLEDGTRWHDGALVPLSPAIPPDPQLRALTTAYVAESKRRLEQKLPTGLSPRPGSPAGAGDAPAELWQFGSDAACAMCHDKATAQWKGTAHAAALDTLAGRGRQRDLYCLGCHTTGFELPGGTRNLETATSYFANVGCECCHGPSVNHVRTQKTSQTHRKVPPEVCLRCHRPDQSAEPFDYAAALKLVLGPGHGQPAPTP